MLASLESQMYIFTPITSGVVSTSRHVEAEELRSRHQAMVGWDMH